MATIALTIILLATQHKGALAYHPALQTIPQPQPAYGATAVVGEALEPCDTEKTQDNARVIAPADDWQKIIFEEANAGDVFLLRGGVYQAADQLRGPEGKPGQPVTIKPYDCEAVTLRGTFRPLSYSVFAGLRLEGVGVPDTKWVVRVDGKNMGPLRTIIFRNNTIVGGDVDAFRISDDVVDVLLLGNHIDGGGNGHDIFVTSENRVKLPDQIVVSNNLLTKAYFDTPSEDMFQVRDVARVEFSHNTCRDGHRMEQCVDIKSTVTPVVVRYNLFDGDTLHLGGPGEDLANGCMVIHETDNSPDAHRIDHNFFRDCRGEAIRFAQGNADEISSGIVRHNIFISQGVGEEDGAIPIWQARYVRFINNTVIRGYLKLGDSLQNKAPTDTVIKNNIFYQTTIDDNTASPAYTYECSHNLLFATGGNGFEHSPCPNTIVAEPLFVDINNDLRLVSGSPGVAAGDDGLDMGANFCVGDLQPADPPDGTQPPDPNTEPPVVTFPDVDEAFPNLMFMPIVNNQVDGVYSGLTCGTP
ncbi:MAG: hypothetical protein R2911_30390 [Caldilineaceae bacterium]